MNYLSVETRFIASSRGAAKPRNTKDVAAQRLYRFWIPALRENILIGGAEGIEASFLCT